MYIIDTNIISEIMRPQPDQNVIWWMQDHNEELCLSSITVHEVYYGIYLLPDSQRKREYLDQINAITRECTDRILGLDAFAGYLCGKMYASTRKSGRQGTIEDCMIAAICQRHNATLVTHNVKDFECYGIDVYDPFGYESDTLKELRRREAEAEQTGKRAR